MWDIFSPAVMRLQRKVSSMVLCTSRCETRLSHRSKAPQPVQRNYQTCIVVNAPVKYESKIGTWDLLGLLCYYSPIWQTYLRVVWNTCPRLYSPTNTMMPQPTESALKNDLMAIFVGSVYNYHYGYIYNSGSSADIFGHMYAIEVVQYLVGILFL